MAMLPRSGQTLYVLGTNRCICSMLLPRDTFDFTKDSGTAQRLPGIEYSRLARLASALGF